MSELSIRSISMPAVDLGLENPLLPLREERASSNLTYPTDIPEDMLDNLNYGKLTSIYPYSAQDSFERQLHTREFKVAVLENEHLEAKFLLEFGGRLYSLLHKTSGKQLLEVNPEFQLANLAIRNAWFSGGIEWNVGTIGHSPFTCSPLFACRVIGSTGEPILRLYEWERFRQTPFQIDVYLPSRSRVLYIFTRIMNSTHESVPIYWWSNIAVPVTDQTRILVPAEAAYCLGCQAGHLEKIKVPIDEGIDISYPRQVRQARDFFFELEKGKFPWIAALDGQGEGLAQLSTPELIGRKLWVWGTSTGGENWQHFLSPSGAGYVEIQAGITRTQLEHLRLPAKSQLSWLEAYGFIEADPQLVHGEDWKNAYQHVGEKIRNLATPGELAEQFRQNVNNLDQPPVEIFQRGSGWGALERKRRQAAFENQQPGTGMVFGDDSLQSEQTPWLTLIETGDFPEIDGDNRTPSFVHVNGWIELVERSLEGKSAQNWYAWYQVGNLRYESGDLLNAKKAWNKSLGLEWTPWAARNLAVLAWEDGNSNEAGDILLEACRAVPDCKPLIIECGLCLNEAGRYREWVNLVSELPAVLKANGRIRLLQAQAELALGDLDTAASFFMEGALVPDLREGENSISDLWVDYKIQQMCQEKNIPETHPEVVKFRENPTIPEGIDYRMRG